MPLDLDEQGRRRLPEIELNEAGQRIFEPDGAVLAAFIGDMSPVSIIRGPIGSGTSSACCIKLGYLATQSPKWSDGVRRSRWFIIRNTYAELRGTTLETWKYWYPENVYGRIVLSRPMIHEMRFLDVHADVFFIALDGPDDISKLRSFEFNGGWINEVEFEDKPVFDEAQSRCRYPPPVDIRGDWTWRGLIGDMNAPSEEHWLPRMTREVPYPDDVKPEDQEFWPEGWGYHVQPPAVLEVKAPDGNVTGYRVNPNAENLRFLRENYYEDTLRGKSRDWIRSRLMNQIVTVVSGDPVWKNFNSETHVIRSPLPFNPNYPVYVSLDFGGRPTAIVAQEINQRVLIQREMRDYASGAATFAPALKKFLTLNYPGATIKFTGDPKGQDKTQSGERTAYQIFEANGMKVKPSPVRANAIEPRLEVVRYALEQSPNGNTRILISSTGCPTLVAGMAGKYHLTKNENNEPVPVKDKYSDPCDCLGYLLIYLGDGREMIGLSAAVRTKAIIPRKRGLNLRRVS